VWRYSDGVADCSRGACTRSGLAKLLRGKHSILDHAQRGHLADIERCRGFRQSDLANWGPFPRAGFLCRLDVRAECPDPGGDPGKPRESIQGLHNHYRRPGQGPHGWTLVPAWTPLGSRQAIISTRTRKMRHGASHDRYCATANCFHTVWLIYARIDGVAGR
jgi:hypothetical protein